MVSFLLLIDLMESSSNLLINKSFIIGQALTLCYNHFVY